MRFIISNGGASGFRDVEALASGLFTWATSAEVPGVELLVDFSAGMSSPGELFRTGEAMARDMVAWGDPGLHDIKVLTVMAATYWAEAEAVLLKRSTPAAPKRGNGSTRV